MRWLKQSTAFTFRIGPFLDSTDGVTAETGLTIAQADIQISKNGGAFAQTSASPTTTHDTDGWYQCPLTTTDTGTLGSLTVQIVMAGALPVWEHFEVVPANVYDSLVLGTDYIDVNAIQWAGTATTAGNAAIAAPPTNWNDLVISTSGVTNSNMKLISDDSTAADNLKFIYNGTGYTDDTAPASRSQINNLSVGSSAISTIADSYTLTTGTQTDGTYASTQARDGAYHTHTDTAGTLDLYYEFSIGGSGVPSTITQYGKATGLNDPIDVYGYNWGTTTWEAIGTIPGGNADNEHTFSMYTSHVGTGANLGKVRVRFYNTGLTTATFYSDQIYVSYAIVSQSAGYANGSIWVNTNASNTNTENYVDGVVENPVSTWAAALTLSGQLGIERFQIINGSSITLSSNSDNYTLLGANWTLALNSQSIVNMVADGASITGIATGSGFEFFKCSIGTGTFADGFFLGCAIAGDLTFSAAGTYYFDQCFSGVAGTATPSIDFGAAVGNTNVNFRHYSGGIEIKNLGATGTDNMSLEGDGQYILNANCTGGTLAVRGSFQKTDNSGAVTISDDANSYTGIIHSGRAQAGGNNTITLAAAASATDGAYDPSEIAVTGGTGAGQSRLILEYNGTTKVAVVDRNWKVNPDATSDYKIGTNPGREHVNEGLAQAGAAGSITLNAFASASDDAYNNQLIFLRSGTGEDQVRLITDYDGTTKVATVQTNWAVNPDATTGYVMIPTSIYSSAEISALVTAATPTTAEIKTAMEADNSDLDYLVTDLVNKKAITIADGKSKQYDDSNTLIGTLATGYSDDGTTVTRPRQVIAK